jgi:hypothetical protein
MNARAAHSVLYEKGRAENAPAPAQGFSVASQESLDGRTLFSRYEPFHINHFSLSSRLHGFAEFGGHPGLLMFENEKHHFGPDVPQPGPEFARLLLQHSSSLKDRGSTPLASTIFSVTFII